MTSTLLDQLRSIFPPSAADELARVLGENKESTQMAIQGLLPTVAGGVLHLASEQEGALRLYKLITSTPFAADPSVSHLVENGDHRQKAAESGIDLLGKLYDQHVYQLVGTTAQYSGISVGSATTLTGLIMSVLLGFLHKQVTTRALTQSQLTALLQGETQPIWSAIPVAFASSLGWFLGTNPKPSPAASTGPVAQPVAGVSDETAAGTPWWRWLLYLLIPLLLLFLLLRSCKDDKPSATSSQPSATLVTTDTIASDLDGNQGARDSVGASADEPQVRVGVDLPGGRKLSLVQNSFTYSLARFLATKGGQTPKVFTFDNLTFDTNSAAITAQARPNVDDLIQIMQAYPSMAIRIEGNTDSTGDEAINDPLSGERAQAVKQALIDGGIEASRLSTRERGDTKPVATNKTEAGRGKNRRIDVIVTKV
ncbi:OmpA family protein [Fibrella forsythiae]|uniref:OmpA family protein n=1 Tax=Fibrella forsythiae TaxID=2817061 RepID=A0ABS3JT70_9BACT|nr:OmpA family protein [Fibrella forsythiae]MBO0953209.1 OmpA family protein [Fibrella forsythiae]